MGRVLAMYDRHRDNERLENECKRLRKDRDRLEQRVAILEADLQIALQDHPKPPEPEPDPAEARRKRVGEKVEAQVKKDLLDPEWLEQQRVIAWEEWERSREFSPHWFAMRGYNYKGPPPKPIPAEVWPPDTGPETWLRKIWTEHEEGYEAYINGEIEPEPEAPPDTYLHRLLGQQPPDAAKKATQP